MSTRAPPPIEPNMVKIWSIVQPLVQICNTNLDNSQLAHQEHTQNNVLQEIVEELETVLEKLNAGSALPMYSRRVFAWLSVLGRAFEKGPSAGNAKRVLESIKELGFKTPPNDIDDFLLYPRDIEIFSSSVKRGRNPEVIPAPQAVSLPHSRAASVTQTARSVRDSSMAPPQSNRPALAQTSAFSRDSSMLFQPPPPPALNEAGNAAALPVTPRRPIANLPSRGASVAGSASSNAPSVGPLPYRPLPLDRAAVLGSPFQPPGSLLDAGNWTFSEADAASRFMDISSRAGDFSLSEITESKDSLPVEASKSPKVSKSTKRKASDPTSKEPSASSSKTKKRSALADNTQKKTTIAEKNPKAAIVEKPKATKPETSSKPDDQKIAPGRFALDTRAAQVLERRELQTAVLTTPGPPVPLPISYEEAELVLRGWRPAPHPCLPCFAIGSGEKCTYEGFGKPCATCRSGRRGGTEANYCTFRNSPDEKFWWGELAATEANTSIPYMLSNLSRAENHFRSAAQLDRLAAASFKQGQAALHEVWRSLDILIARSSLEDVQRLYFTNDEPASRLLSLLRSVSTFKYPRFQNFFDELNSAAVSDKDRVFIPSTFMSTKRTDGKKTLAPFQVDDSNATLPVELLPFVPSKATASPGFSPAGSPMNFDDFDNREGPSTMLDSGDDGKARDEDESNVRHRHGQHHIAGVSDEEDAGGVWESHGDKSSEEKIRSVKVIRQYGRKGKGKEREAESE
ncbi:hypothetical protein BJ165DRAFT_1582759 [Panaeolus papilionaceus]|nr:hypothetical protein BJ165DRAFT_1582759 [Panaeolus papilionaceus]